MLTQGSAQRFFGFAAERHAIHVRRGRGHPWPWTDDPILREYRFTNVFRELDRTTVWFNRHVRSRQAPPLTLLATVVFRWFNKIETGRAIFESDAGRPFQIFATTGETDPMRDAIVRSQGDGPYVNGAYIIKTPDGMNKLDGVLQCCWMFDTTSVDGISWAEATDRMRRGEWDLQTAWNWVRGHPYQGDFTAYEVVTDLRHTPLLSGAGDIMTWANAGPGAIRGLARLHGRPLSGGVPHKEQTCEEMRELLALSEDRDLWWDRWPRWEMRDVEHTLCEFDKYERARLNQGRPKQRYHHGHDQSDSMQAL